MNLSQFIEAALAEDLPSGDKTTDNLADLHKTGSAKLIAKQNLILSGSLAFIETFRQVDSSVEMRWTFKDGSQVRNGEVICEIQGKLSSLLKAERTALNFLGHLSGVATKTAQFVKKTQFERAGVFVYSREEGTPAHDFKNHVVESLKKRRLDILMHEQKEISKNVQNKFIGKTLDVLIEEQQKGEEHIFLGRSEYDAPDVDGLVYVRSRKKLKIGDMVSVLIDDALEYDLCGEHVS